MDILSNEGFRLLLQSKRLDAVHNRNAMQIAINGAGKRSMQQAKERHREAKERLYNRFESKHSG